jgi:tRNA(Ile)-lysidine synthase
MFKEFLSFIGKEKLFEPGQRILLAISGGMDSMAMCFLFRKAHFQYGIAHCNFQLRGDASDQDEDFVKSVAERTGVPFYSGKFATSEHAKLKGISIQMAARELRYTWFSELISPHGYDYVATAHHRNDQEETFFINLMRASGIAGFHGIPVKKEQLIRPMLFASRKEIAAYVKKNNIPYREDNTNSETKYLRNKIRHKLIPVLREISPGFSEILSENINRIKEVEQIFRNTVEKERKKYVRIVNGVILIPIGKLKKLNPAYTYVYEFLAPYHFNFSVCRDIVDALDETESRIFLSDTHQLVKERDHLVITSIPDKTIKKQPEYGFRITEKTKTMAHPVPLGFRRIIPGKSFRINPSVDHAYFDLHKLTFPLTIRKWQKGDFFYPYGSPHRKKLSDYFTDEKFSRSEKENTWLLCSGENIIWVIGHRPDHRFRVTPGTDEVLIIHLKE